MKKLQGLFLCLSLLLLASVGVSFTTNIFSSAPVDETPVEVAVEKDKEEITEYEFKPFTDYYCPASRAETTITGNGKQATPYVVNSLSDFIWLSTKSIPYQYVELNCDIILNDEKFDNNGNPSGGDGVVYSWKPIDECYNLRFNGNGHTISGMYIKDETLTYTSLYGNKNIYECKNLNFRDCYIYGKTNACHIGRALNVENCNVYSGYVEATGSNACGVVQNAEKIYNCNNYADIKSGGQPGIGGIVAGRSTLIMENCNNYGSITKTHTSSWACGGLVGELTQGKSVIKNCKIYGNVNSTGQGIGGIFGAATGNAKTQIRMENCVNYGRIISNKANGWLGGIAGHIRGDIEMIACENAGQVDNVYLSGELVGRISKDKLGNYVSVTIKNCIMNNNSKNSMIEEIAEATKAIIQGCKINYSGAHTNILIEKINSTAELYIKDIQIESEKTDKCNFKLAGVIKETCKKAEISNIIINIKKANATTFENIYNANSSANIEIKSAIVNVKQGGQSYYYGDSFSGYYVSWKTGKIGLKALDGVGTFQGIVDEEVLANKNFEKRTIA